MNEVISKETSEKHYKYVMYSSNSLKCRAFCCYRRQKNGNTWCHEQL